ncbi:hypothetical protein, conserved [Babesia bigemina]|uniref:Uncharacterized protein n=1 Tax=Babesia bigemina TaxID=5866 RepID=A0A061D2M3_BABBI|nr:hypothetical protein, conserved [Babesia bigemina]CDR94312.1 hypothetical protein, conserved [Babesia bigemina]|eukprot:XP_012766498.1 hypothetical protein, conserved [Babesia bigemina]
MRHARLVLLIVAIVFGGDDASALNTRVFASVRGSYTGNDAARVPQILRNHIAFTTPSSLNRRVYGASGGFGGVTSLHDVECAEGVDDTGETRRVINRIGIRRHRLYVIRGAPEFKATNEVRKKKSQPKQRSGRNRTLEEVSKHNNSPNKDHTGAKKAKCLDFQGICTTGDVVPAAENSLKAAKGSNAVAALSVHGGDATTTKENDGGRPSANALGAQEKRDGLLQTRDNATVVEAEWSDDRAEENVDVVPEIIEPSTNTQEGSKAREGNVAAISNRRLHVLNSLFSDQHRIKTREVVSVLYQKLGSPYANIASLRDIIASRVGNANNAHRESLHFNEGTDVEHSEQHVYRCQGDSNAVSQSDGSNNVNSLSNRDGGDIVMGSAKSQQIGPGTVEQRNDQQATEDGRAHETRDNLEAASTSSMSSIPHPINDVQVLASNEQLNALQSMVRRKRISAIFLPVDGKIPKPEHDKVEQPSHPKSKSDDCAGFIAGDNVDSSEHCELFKNNLPKEKDDHPVYDIGSTNAWDTDVGSTSTPVLEASVSTDESDVLGNTPLEHTLNDLPQSSMQAIQTASESSGMTRSIIQDGSDRADYMFYRSRDDVAVNLASEYHHGFDCLLLSVPTKTKRSHKKKECQQIELNKGGLGEAGNSTVVQERMPSSTSTVDDMRLSNSVNSRKEPEQSNQHDTIGFTIPVNMFTLPRGFLASLYKTYLRPSLISTLECAFNTNLEGPCGVMDLLTLGVDITKLICKSVGDIDRNTLRQHLRNVVVRSNFFEDDMKDTIYYEGEATELPRKVRHKLAKIFKLVKDEVVLRNSVDLLTTLLGRPPTIGEMAFSLGHDDPRKLEMSLSILTSYTKQCFELFSKSLGDVVLMKLESDAGFRRKYPRTPLTPLDPHMWKTHSIVKEMLWQRICSIHLNTLAAHGEKVVGQLYGISCSAARHDLLKAKLPEHLPIGTYRLAKRAKVLYTELFMLKSRIAYEVRRAAELGIPFNKDPYKDDHFAQRVVEVELANVNTKEGTAESGAKSVQIERLIEEEMSARLNVSMDAIQEALDASKIREISGPKIVAFSDKANRFKRKRGLYVAHLQDFDDFGVPEDPDTTPLKPWTMEYKRDSILRKSLRMVAVEALDDRAARFVFMAYLNLFLNTVWNAEDLTRALGLSGPDVLDLVFYAARAHCQEYECWRIKLKLPPYVNELSACPELVPKIELPTGKLPHHIASPKRSRRPRGANFSRPVHPAMKDRYKRMRSIKPRIGTMKDSLAQYHKNFAAMQKVLEQSPLYYLSDIPDTVKLDPA